MKVEKQLRKKDVAASFGRRGDRAPLRKDLCRNRRGEERGEQTGSFTAAVSIKRD